MEDSSICEDNKERTSIPTYCVSGANGYIGSWLVNSLLEKGFKVHATVRDPATCMHLQTKWNGGDRLRLFQADLLKEGSFDEAVEGCEGVFHVAASMQFGISNCENIEAYVESNIINPAIEGTINILKSCLKSKFVKRVVYTSSVSTITAKDKQGKWRSLVDENCQTSIEDVRKTKASGWVYALSKLRAEEEAFHFAMSNNIDLISVITTTVGGPFLTSSVPSSIKVLLSPVTGHAEMFNILYAVNSRMGSIALVHIEDICNAHIFLMKQPQAQGRYLCCIESYTLPELMQHIAKHYPSSIVQRFVGEHYSIPSEISSKKLKDLGFKYAHGIEAIIRDTIISCLNYGFLPPIENN